MGFKPNCQGNLVQEDRRMIDVPKHSQHGGNAKISYGVRLSATRWKKMFSDQMKAAGFTLVEIDDLIPIADKRRQRGHTIKAIVAQMIAERS